VPNPAAIICMTGPETAPAFEDSTLMRRSPRLPSSRSAKAI
jgi:hypothetical protein